MRRLFRRICPQLIAVGASLGFAAQQPTGPPGPGSQPQGVAGAPANSSQPQKPAHEQTAAGGIVDAAAQGDPNDVLKATNAREVAGLLCSTATDDPCLGDDARKALDAVSTAFNGTLIG